MGLYDNYKLSNSTGVQQFAGSIVPDLKLAKDQADARYEQSQEGLINLPEVLNQAPINPQDKPVWNQINNEAQEKLASWTKRPDLENATIDIYRYSKQVGNKLKTLADQKKARDTYISEIDKREDIDPLTKQWAKETADADYGQLQFGPDGRPVNQYQGKIPAKQVSKAEKMQKALQFVTGNSSAEIQGYDSKDGMVTYKIGNEIKTISEAEVMNAYKSSKDLDPEWQASDEQEQAVKLYHATKGITDDVVLNQIEANPSNLEIQRTKELMETRGYPPALAFKEAKKESIKRNMDNAEAAYARTKMSTNTSSTEITTPGPEYVTKFQQEGRDMEKARMTAEEKAKETLRFEGTGAVVNVESWASTIADLRSKGIQQHQQVYDQMIKEADEKQTKLNIAEASGDQRAASTLRGEISTLQNKMKVASNTIEMYSKIEKEALDDAARTIPGVVNFEQLKKKELPAITAEAAKQFPKGVEILGKRYSPTELSEAIASGSIVLGTTQGGLATISTINGVVANLSANDYNRLQDVVNKGTRTLKNVINLANTSKTSKYSIQDKYITLDAEEQKAINDADLGFVADDGVTPQEIPSGYSKVDRSGAMYQTTGLIKVRYLDDKGNVLAQGWNTTAGTDVRKKVGERMMKDKNPSTQATGAELYAGPDEDISKFKAGNSVEIHDNGKPLTYWMGDKAIPVRMDFHMNGTFSVIDLSTNKAVKLPTGKILEQISDLSTAQRIYSASKYRNK